MQNVTTEYCVKLIETHEPSDRIKQIPAMGIDGFTKFLMSDQCDIFDPKHSKVSTPKCDKVIMAFIDITPYLLSES